MKKTHDTAVQSAGSERSRRGRPRKSPGLTRLTVLIHSRQVRYLDELASAIRKKTGNILSRADLIRASIDSLEALSTREVEGARNEAEVVKALAGLATSSPTARQKEILVAKWQRVPAGRPHRVAYSVELVDGRTGLLLIECYKTPFTADRARSGALLLREAYAGRTCFTMDEIVLPERMASEIGRHIEKVSPEILVFPND